MRIVERVAQAHVKSVLPKHKSEPYERVALQCRAWETANYRVGRIVGGFGPKFNREEVDTDAGDALTLTRQNRIARQRPRNQRRGLLVWPPA